MIQKEHKHFANAVIIPEIGNLLKEGKCVTFNVKGRSMRAMIEGGRDSVEMRAVPEGYELKPMDVVLAEIMPKTYVLHRIVKREGDRLTLMGDGNLRGMEVCHVNNVLGIATAFIRKGKRLDMNSRKWRFYSKFWTTFKPLRRLMIFAAFPHVPYIFKKKKIKK